MMDENNKWVSSQIELNMASSMECGGRSADMGVLFVNVSCATGAKQITIG